MKKSIWTLLLLLCTSLVIAQGSTQVELIEYKGNEIETIHLTIASDIDDIEAEWRTFISKHRDFEANMEDAKAKEALTANNATVGRAGHGVDLVKVKFVPEATGHTNAYFFTSDEFQKNPPAELSPNDKAYLQRISKNFKIYAETGLFEEDETQDINQKRTRIR